MLRKNAGINSYHDQMLASALQLQSVDGLNRNNIYKHNSLVILAVALELNVLEQLAIVPSWAQGSPAINQPQPNAWHHISAIFSKERNNGGSANKYGNYNQIWCYPQYWGKKQHCLKYTHASSTGLSFPALISPCVLAKPWSRTRLKHKAFKLLQWLFISSILQKETSKICSR